LVAWACGPEAVAEVLVPGEVALLVAADLRLVHGAFPHAGAVEVIELVGDADGMSRLNVQYLGHFVLEVVEVAVVVVEGAALVMALAGAVAVVVVEVGEGGIAGDGPGAGLVAVVGDGDGGGVAGDDVGFDGEVAGVGIGIVVGVGEGGVVFTLDMVKYQQLLCISICYRPK
jgi:hypothetical protein